MKDKAIKDRHQRPSYPLRMSDELRAALEEAAQESSRSLHAEIIARLENSFKQPDPSINALDSLVAVLNILQSRGDSVLDETIDKLKKHQAKEKPTPSLSGS